MGRLLGFAAVFLQIAVFLQPLLPVKYQIAPVCETITQFLVTTSSKNIAHSSVHHQHEPISIKQISHEHNHHDPGHQCQYCTVLGHLILPPELELKQILVRIQVRLLAYQQTFAHIYFALLRLFLLPQGRAPPVGLII